MVRASGELSSPVELWTTSYGRDLLLKASLLLPILVLARRNRRLVAAKVAGGLALTRARLRVAARRVQLELAIGTGIVLVAAMLVAEVPGPGVSRRPRRRSAGIAGLDGGLLSR